MSFDIFFQSFPRSARTLKDIPDSFSPRPLGSLKQVRAKLKRALPALQFDEDGNGSLTGDGFSAELHLGLDDPCGGFMVALRGGAGGAAVIDAICRGAGFRAVAPGTDSLIASGVDIGGAFEGWEAHRDRVLGVARSAPSRNKASRPKKKKPKNRAAGPRDRKRNR
jgi:hypothetical protein